MLSEDQAIARAREAVDGVADVPDDVDGEVTTRLVVTFPWEHPPGELGSDYHAQVVLDAETGEVVQILGAA